MPWTATWVCCATRSQLTQARFSAPAAIAAALQTQVELIAEPGGVVGPPRARMALHTGSADCSGPAAGGRRRCPRRRLTWRTMRLVGVTEGLRERIGMPVAHFVAPQSGAHAGAGSASAGRGVRVGLGTGADP